ncbi:glycoside hydrolase family 43 protein [Asticcacaulis sp. AND118]|uniref:glycoside hydrolase family 43 protein n=1 Tax=Asticcacaulis sp. AND118 TaxID=2840468 RepID=UPI001D000B73|nr:glycoside hydrolase family 43 protein [Asticcacaulis sp. AND118]UDF03107.1 glycoside hydrolase family 43 protein [Asticcacaulis sp. AND118]
MTTRRTLLNMTAALAVSGVSLSAGDSARADDQATLTLPNMPLHDPWIVADKATRTYHLFTSNRERLSGQPGIGVMAYRSRDLKHWTKPHRVFALPQGVWADGGGWAPEVHQWQGRWYLFVTVHNEKMPLPVGASGQANYRRATVLAVADTPEGPFTLVRNGEPVAPKALMTLDGTLYADPAGQPWMVYAHEWIQTGVGTMEALPLNPDLSAKGPPRLLFKGSDSPWAVPQQGQNIVTDGPQLYRTSGGALMMLWSSWGADGYIQTLARSASGDLFGPWEQLPMWLGKGSGHGMLFHTFDGQLMLIVHRPFKNARGYLYEVRDTGPSLELVRQRTDLDFDATPLPPFKP